MKVVVQPNIARDAIVQRLSGIEGAEVVVVDGSEDLRRSLADADVAVISGHAYTKDVAQALASPSSPVKFIQLLTAGYEDVEALGVRPGLHVANAGESWSVGVAEHAIALMLSLVKCLPDAYAAQARGTWDRSYTQRMGTLHGKTLAILGYGSIGREIARRAKAFDMHVVGVSRSAIAAPPADEVLPVGQLHDVLARADFIVLSMPSTAATRRMFGPAAIAACRRGAVLINIARGNLIDTDAVIDALRSGQLGGAGIDATDPEPLPDGSPLWTAPNTVITAHTSGACGPEGRQRLADFVGGNVERFVRGQVPTHLLKLRAWGTPETSGDRA